MQSASPHGSLSRLQQSPWDRRRTLRFRSSLEKCNVLRPKFSPPSESPTFDDPPKVSCRFKLGEIDGCGYLNPVPLPVFVHGSGKASRYFWDGAQLRLVDSGRDPVGWFGSDRGIHRLLEVLATAARDLLVPGQVQSNYMGYLKWKFVHRVFSSALQVLATQAMFHAMGIGSTRSLPSAAAWNWVLKNGLGRLSRCIYTAKLGSSFDTNLKRVRFSTSVLFSLSIGVELLTPAFPQYFLLLATMANIAKSISLAAFLATGPAVHRSFAIADNLGEVSAKSQIQTVCFDNLGLLLAVLMNGFCKANKSIQAGFPLVLYPVFAAVDLFAIYQGLNFVHLQTLTKDRLEKIVDTWIHSGYVPSPAEISKIEGISIFPDKVRFGSGIKLWPIRIGCPEPKVSLPMVSVLTIQALTDEDLFFVCLEMSHKDSKSEKGILLSLREGSHSSDIILGLLQACLIRKALIASWSSWGRLSEDGFADGPVLAEWFEVVKDNKLFASREIKSFTEELQRAGWAVKNILLNAQEQRRYSFVTDVAKQEDTIL